MSDSAEVMLAVEDSGAAVTCIGEFDLGSAGKFGSALADAVFSGKPVTVDFSLANFIDSAILQLLVIHGKALSLRGDRLRIVVASDSYPAFVLKTVGFDILMDIVTESTDNGC